MSDLSDTSERNARFAVQIDSEGLVLSVTSAGSELAGTRHFAVFLRLTVDPDGRLVSGAIVDIQGTPRKQFMEWQELTPAVRDWLEGEEQERTAQMTSAVRPVLNGDEQEGGQLDGRSDSCT